jgi:hypothetical protein
MVLGAPSLLHLEAVCWLAPSLPGNNLPSSFSMFAVIVPFENCVALRMRHGNAA